MSSGCSQTNKQDIISQINIQEKRLEVLSEVKKWLLHTDSYTDQSDMDSNDKEDDLAATLKKIVAEIGGLKTNMLSHSHEKDGSFQKSNQSPSEKTDSNRCKLPNGDVITLHQDKTTVMK